MMNTQPTYQSGYSSPVFSNVRKSTVSSVSTIIMTLPNVSNETIPKGMPSIFRRDSQMPCTINDKEWAEQLMSTHNPGSQVDYFTYKDSTAVLALVAEGSITNATPGLVAALLEYDADVNLKRRKSSSLWKRISDKDQSDIRSNLLELATQNCSSQILLLLSPGADETSANQALPHAIMQNDLEKINILLARGANASSLCTQFAHIIETGSAEVTAKLMSRTQGACQACRDKGLIRAATLGLAEKVAILLKNGADVLFENAAALLAAIHHGWDDVAAAMVCKGGSDIPVQLLDGALGDAYGKGLLRTVEACLEAGAKGINTNTTLVDAVRRGHLGLVENLVRHGAAVDHDSGAAVVSAVQSGQPELLRVVLNGMPCSATLAAAIVHSPKLGHIQVVQQMIGLLLVAGSRGVAVDQVLLQVVDKRLLRGEERIRLSLVHLLLTKGGANVNVQSGTCMRVAAQEGWLTILNELLQCQPSLESRIAALQSAMQLQAAARKRTVAMVLKSAENDLAATHKLRDAAVTLAAKSLHIDILEYLTYSALPPTTVQAGLDSVTSTGSRWLSPAGLQVVQFFLSRGVSGKSVEHAFYQAAIAVEQDAVEMLVTFIKSKSVLNLALMGMADHSVKWLSVDDCNIWLVASLLEWGAYGDSINQAFLKAVHAYTQGKASKTLLDLLLRVGKADVNYMSGEVLMVAVRSGDVQLVTHLASLGATKDSMTRAFSQAIRAPLEETIVLELIQALLFDKDSSSKPDLVVVLPDRWPHIFECLYAHPNSVKLVKRLAELGCDIDAEINTEIYDKIKERSNALSWALRQYHDGPIISSQTIEALIELKG